MKFGVVGSSGSAQQVVEMAVAAEAAGWDGFFSWDGISIGEVDTFDPWVLLGAIAGLTSRITLGAMVFALARRHPWKVAREAITVDRLSGGRLVMPVGLGAAADDGGFSRVSGGVTDRRLRAELLDDTLAILERAWTGEKFSYQGTHHSVADLVFRPRPIARPRIPIWVVAAYPAARSMGRAVRWDGIVPSKMGAPFVPLQPADIREIAGWVAEHRESSAQPFEFVVEGQLSEDRAAATERVRGLAEAGATWWIESRWEGESATPGALLATIANGPPRLAAGTARPAQ